MKKLIIAALLFPNLAIADEIIIVSKKLPIPNKKIVIIDAEKIEGRQALAVQDVFRTVSAINFSQAGGIGAPSNVRIRGAEGDKTLFIIDGQKINDPSLPNGGYDFGQTMIGDISQIEIMKGIGSSLYGSDAIGGIINIITQKPTNKNTIRINLESGSENTQNLKAFFGDKIGDLNYAIYGSKFKSDGISQFSKTLGGREKDGFKQDLLGLKAWIPLYVNTEVFAKTEYSKSTLDFDGFAPPFYNFGDTDEYGETKNQTNFIKIDSQTNDRFSHSLSWSQFKSKRQNFDPTQSPKINFDSFGNLQSLDYLATFELSKTISFLGGATFEKSDYEIAYPAPWDPTPAKILASSNTKSLFIEARYRPIEELSAKIGIRNDDHSQFGNKISWHSNLSWRIPIGFDFFASLGDGFKAPSLYQLYSDYGNIDLVPETAKGLEIGIAKKFPWLGFSMNYFQREAANQIDFFSCFSASNPKCATRPYGFYDNIANTKTNGFEYDANISYSSFDIDFGGATITAQNNDANSFDYGNQLARQPKNTAFLNLKYQINTNFDVFILGQYVSKRRENIYSNYNLAAYDIWSLGFRKALNDKYEIYGRVENIFDTKYETVKNYGAYGKSAKIGIRIKYN